MRIYMQTPPVEGKNPRFYQLLLQPDLLGGWNLVRESGPQGGRGQVRSEHFNTREEAEAALQRRRDDQAKRGYRVVFTRGEEQP
ncbi:WGR domain-containing protein [Thiohalospira halophila]|jgi:predicted DNA-binding WGR domain protein|nr:WGR domain-containing protein [Thiohalospira halophila]